ncbi:DUF6286 domain-containing protein [Micromonospora sp. WMMD812]|uniref:DUF6286 domain-containing protein n=1 Tax=Micromonospora sp. WMMD812 TaxID=3015152 RepID=UPI00248BAA42|nr:DUF6286 domain-containing protein [Micromonospora sp. WMMD812]WBB69009.1 DUF6286 domain-containing protein [Micromonospora sp. WMMD812]
MRTANRLATLLLATALLGAGALVVVEGLLAVAGRAPLLVDRARWARALGATRWDDPAVRASAVALILVGLAVLAAELRRWSPRRLDAGEGWHLHRRSVERRLAVAVRSVPGVRRARVRIRRRGAEWRPRVVATGDPAARPEVEFAVHQELHRLAAPRPGRIDVRLLPRRGAA